MLGRTCQQRHLVYMKCQRQKRRLEGGDILCSPAGLSIGDHNKNCLHIVFPDVPEKKQNTALLWKVAV